MIESILVKKNVSLKAKITIKSLISAGVVALAVLLPQLVHIWAGSAGGVQWLPMYLPVLLGACLLGVWWGLGVGIVSPVVSFLITFAMGNPMPAAARLPFMIAELAMIAAIAGLFSRKISQNGWMAFPAVLLAFVGGRIFFLLRAAIFQNIAPFTAAAVWSQITTGLLGLVVQAILVPFLILGIRYLADRDKNHD